MLAKVLKVGTSWNKCWLKTMSDNAEAGHLEFSNYNNGLWALKFSGRGLQTKIIYNLFPNRKN